MVDTTQTSQSQEYSCSSKVVEVHLLRLDPNLRRARWNNCFSDFAWRL